MDSSHLLMYEYGFFALLGVAGLIGGLKTLDWAIAQKYVTHSKCEKCRGEVYKSIATDHDLLKELNAKVDLILENLQIKTK